MKKGKITYAMAAHRTVARIVALGGRFTERDDGVLQVALDAAMDKEAVKRIIHTVMNGNPKYADAVIKAGRQRLATQRQSDDGSAA